MEGEVGVLFGLIIVSGLNIRDKGRKCGERGANKGAGEREREVRVRHTDYYYYYYLLYEGYLYIHS
jgi:hypothetical protein